MAEQARLEAIVYGRVQGVAFRHYTRLRALELGVVGYVRNRWDGTVEVVAEGSRGALEQLFSFLQVGPRAAFVTEVGAAWRPASGQFSHFEVRF